MYHYGAHVRHKEVCVSQASHKAASVHPVLRSVRSPSKDPTKPARPALNDGISRVPDGVSFQALARPLAWAPQAKRPWRLSDIKQTAARPAN